MLFIKAEYSNLHFIREASGTANFLTVDMEHLFITWRGLDWSLWNAILARSHEQMCLHNSVSHIQCIYKDIELKL